MDAPLVVAVQGAAAGAGFSLALLGDLVYAAESAVFTMAYTAAGLSPDGGSTFLLPRMVGLRRAQELTLVNRRLSGREAADWGIATACVSDDRSEEHTSELQSLMRTSYALFCLKNTKAKTNNTLSQTRNTSEI